MSEILSDNSDPLVSIVIPAYNHASYLSQAVKSVLTQNYSNVELIVIDDGSTDNTVDVLTELGSGFRWESQLNIGQSRTLTRGWEMAKGEILGYLSADDILEPEAVATSVQALMLMPDAVATYCDFKLIDPQSRLVRTVELEKYSYDRMLSQVSCPVGPGAFFRRCAYLKSGPWNPDYRQMPDYDFWLRLGLHGSFIHLPRVLAGFRVHEGSQTYSTTTPERAVEPVLIVTDILNDLATMNFDTGFKCRALANANLVSAQLHLRAHRFNEAFSHIRLAIRCSARTVFAPRTLRLLFNALFNRTFHRMLWQVRGIFKGVRE